MKETACKIPDSLQAAERVVGRHIREDSPLLPDDLEALRKGDHRAYDKIYLRWRKPLFGFLYALMRSKDDAEDITQDVFINIWENRQKIDPSKNIKYYLYLIAKQSALKYFRKKKVHDGYVAYQKNNEFESFGSEEIVIAKELELLKDLALSRMPVYRRNIYKLNYEDGLSNEQIAQKLDISKETVYSQLSLARKQLKEIITMTVLLFFN